MIQICYCFGIARGVLYGGITRETDEEIRDMLKTHMDEFDIIVASVMSKM